MESNKYKNTETIKFLYSYGGKILPRYTDGIRYAGGLTRVLAVDCSISFTKLMVKLGEFCGSSVNLRCQLLIGLETLILITSDNRLRRDGRHPISSDDLPLIVRAFSSALLSDYSRLTEGEVGGVWQSQPWLLGLVMGNFLSASFLGSHLVGHRRHAHRL